MNFKVFWILNLKLYVNSIGQWYSRFSFHQLRPTASTKHREKQEENIYPKLSLQIHANKGFVLPAFSPSSEHFNACQPERALQRTLRFYVSSFLCAREASV